MATTDELRTHRKQLMGLVRDLQTNRTTIKRMLDWYGVFAFTGGNVPRGSYSLVSITSYLEHPFATNRISTGEVTQYEHLVEVAAGLGQRAAVGPKTLRCRHAMAEVFRQVASEIKTLGSTLESVFTKVLKEQESIVAEQLIRMSKQSMRLEP